MVEQETAWYGREDMSEEEQEGEEREETEEEVRVEDLYDDHWYEDLGYPGEDLGQTVRGLLVLPFYTPHIEASWYCCCIIYCVPMPRAEV